MIRRFCKELFAKGRKALFLLLLPFSVQALTNGSELTTVTVQFEISQDMIKTETAYSESMEKAMDEAMKEGPADLVIFPEYLGVFAALIPYREYLSEPAPFTEVWRDISQDHPEWSSLRDLFIAGASSTELFLNSLWSDLARKYKTYILSGSRFAYTPLQDGLMNQAVVYAPDGSIAYTQSKYFLTEFEEDILGLSPGDLRDIQGFTIKDHLIRLTICRDTFLKKWEYLYTEGDLWIDIKANGTAYTPDQRDLFTRALPARLAETPIPYGITACLTGRFLDLLWEGESSIIYNESGGSVTYLKTTQLYDRFDIIRKTLP